MARADKGPTKPRSPDQDPARRQQPGAGGPSRQGGDADRQKLKDNQDQLQVDNDHKTPDMRKHHRGTFP